MLNELGLSVVRTVPFEMIPGLISGAYSLHGGVVRNGAGQIVAHLVSSSGSSLASLVLGVDLISSIVSNGQLYMLAKDVHALQSTVSSVLTVASTGAALSGVGLVVSIAGFAYLNRRIERVEKLIVEVKDLIEMRYMAELKSAVGYMKGAEENDIGPENRRALLFEAQKSFSTLSHLYGDLLPKTIEAKNFRVLEDFYSLAFTGASIVNSELGMGDIAVRQFRDHRNHWTSTVRQHINQQLIADYPEKLQMLSPDILTTSEMLSILDFSADTNRGYEWLDEFRKPNGRSRFEKAKGIPSDMSRWARGFREADSKTIESAKTLVRKAAILGSHDAHLEFLAQRKVSVGEFSAALKKALDKSGAEALCVVHSTGA